MMVYPDTSRRCRVPGVLLAQHTLLGHLSAYLCAHERVPQPGDLFWSPARVDIDLAAFAPGCWRAGTSGVPLLAYNGPFEADKAFALIEKYGVRNCFLPLTTLRQDDGGGTGAEGDL
jgi:acetyl-CoA synthetase